jgi:hypothetical protein
VSEIGHEEEEMVGVRLRICSMRKSLREVFVLGSVSGAQIHRQQGLARDPTAEKQGRRQRHAEELTMTKGS